MKNIIYWIFLLIPLASSAQTGPDKYWIQFKDKDNSSFSIYHPEEFLSYRAIQRRTRYNIEITEQDLPVNEAYIRGLAEVGAVIIHSSKWFNGASVMVTDLLILEKIRELPFVSNIKTVKILKGDSQINKFEEIYQFSSVQTESPDTSFFDYGSAGNQIGMINGHILHNQGFRGEGMLIAILDGGFTNVDKNPAFDSLWQNNQIIDHWDYLEGRPLTFDKHTHGGHVLSIMGGNIPGILVGSAPKASFMLYRTEDGGSEYTIEEDNWVVAAEHADSAGADLINSSLAYTKFTDPSMDYSYEDMDGNTTRITQAADFAASRGILVVTAAANEGNTDWKYIGAPADGDSVFTIGAVGPDGVYASFSSIGPTSDGRIKPNVTAQGQETAVLSSSGEAFYGNGTSFSSPLICGITACLWQANRNLNNISLMKIIEQSATRADNPDYMTGYGIPNYGKAYLNVIGIDSVNTSQQSIIRTFPNPFSANLNVDYYSPTPQAFEIKIMDIQGRLVYNKSIDPGFVNLTRLIINDLHGLTSGTYFLQIVTEDTFRMETIVKQNN